MRKVTKKCLMMLLFCVMSISLLITGSALGHAQQAKADGVTTVSVSNVEFLGFEGGNAAIALYRVSLATSLPGTASTANVSPRTLAVQSNGAVAADVRGEGTNNTIIIRMLYGLIKSGATSIGNLDDGTVVTLKAGIPFALSCGSVQFDMDYQLTYNTGNSTLQFVQPVRQLSVSAVSFVGNEGDNAAIGLYRITLANPMPSVAGTTFASPNTIAQKSDGNSAADIRGEGTNNSLILRVPYGRVKTGATSISDLDDGTVITIKSGINFTLSNGTFKFAEDFELEYLAGATSFAKRIEVTTLNISSVSFIGNESAAIGLYRINLASPMVSVADTTSAPRGLVVQSNGTAAADIRGEGTNNSLVVRMPYGLIKSGATSISSLDDGTIVTIKSGINFTLSNGTFKFAEDFELEYLAGATSFAKKVEVVELDISSVEFIGNESAAIGLYRVNLATPMSAVADTTASPRGLVVQSNGVAAADIRGENTTNSLVVRMPYGLIKSGATSISSLDDGTIVTIKSGIRFTLSNGTFVFKEDFVLEVNKSKGCFVEYVEKTYTEISMSSIAYNNAESTAIDIYKITLNQTLDYSIDNTFATVATGYGLELPNGEKAGYIRGAGNTNYLYLRVCYGFFDSSATGNKATKASELDNEQGLVLKAGENFTFDGVNYYYFDKDYNFYFSKATNTFYYVASDVEVSIESAAHLRDVDNPVASDYVLSIGVNTENVAANTQVSALFNGGATGVVRKADDTSHAGYMFAEGSSGRVYVRMYAALVAGEADLTKIEDGATVLLKGNVKYTFDNVNFFHFDTDYKIIFNKYMNLWYVCKDIDSTKLAYNEKTSSWEELNPTIFVRYQDDKVTNKVSSDADTILVMAGSDRDSLVCEGYDLVSMYRPATVDLSDALVDGKFVVGSYEVVITFTDSFGATAQRIITLNVEDCSYASYTYEDGSVVYDYFVNGTDYTVLSYRNNKTSNIFVGWVLEDELYYVGDKVENATGYKEFVALSLDYKMMDGAAIRVTDDKTKSGIRFAGLLKESDYLSLSSVVSSVEYGTLILPFDMLAQGQYPNLEDFVVDEDILKIGSTVHEIEDGYIKYYGGIVNLFENNYTRSFAGRGYITITYKNGNTRTFYTEFNSSNVRSVKYVALMVQKDTEEYNKFNEDQQKIIDSYTKVSTIELLDYETYSTERTKIISLNFIPSFSAIDGYENDYNRGLIEDIKAAGFNTVVLTGFIYPTSDVNVKAIKKVISLFNEYGIKSIVFAGNHAETVNSIYTSYEDMPDFSDCEGFLGFYVWDEAITDEQFEALVDYAEMFKTVYGTTSNYLYMNDVGYAYMDEYCEQVLANLPDGVEKYLSTYSYPIRTDKSLANYFLSNLATLKLLSIEYESISSIILQSSCWPKENEEIGRVPTAEELRLQVYTALAFGIDDISFFTYSTLEDNGNGTAPVDKNGVKNDAYDDLKAVLSELNGISQILQWFKWQGVMLNIESGSNDEVAYNNAINGYKPTIDGVVTDVGSQGLGEYLLNVNDTNLIDSISNGDYKHNFILGVFLDNNGNEAYMLSNYNDITTSREQTITINFKQNVTKVIIYRNGIKEEHDITNNTLEIALGDGEGVFILPSQIG